jgi:3-methyl-2-oxobutanoate hydroxymethyltransferase
MSTQNNANASSNNANRAVTTQRLFEMKSSGERISMLTAYDFTMARLVDEGGADVILVGDSAANVMAGYESTIPITMDQMIYHTQCVVRGVKRALVVADLPFMSYQLSSKQALEAAGRMMKEAGAHAVKLEGADGISASIKRITQAGIPVMAHLGLTPQSIYQFGSYKVRAKEEEEAEKLISDAKRVEEAGAFAVVLEKIPSALAKRVTEALSIPTIGIGAGNYCDGQVLVLHDMLGMNDGFEPRFLRKYASIANEMRNAVTAYCKDVKSGDFPSEAESY